METKKVASDVVVVLMQNCRKKESCILLASMISHPTAEAVGNSNLGKP